MPRRNHRPRKPRRTTPLAVQPSAQLSTDALAWSLVHRGLASPQILGSTRSDAPARREAR